jgi:CRISPR-associated protein Csm3
MQLHGRVFISSNIVVKTGLHIGGSGGAFAIGGVDNPVIIDQLTRQPYIPGSSLRGKMRSLTEKYLGRVKGQRISQCEIHSCHDRRRHEDENKAEYMACPICNIYGITAEGYNLPTRLLVRDTPLLPESADRLRAAKTSLPYTEVKTEVAIDRVTSQANPRDSERVPAGAVFGPMEMVYSIYQLEDDVNWLSILFDGLELLQDDYLGGGGSRGNGKVVFAGLTLTLKRAKPELYRQPIELGHYATLAELSQNSATVLETIWTRLQSRA